MPVKPKVLFFSTGTAERSQMAESFLETLTQGGVEAESTAVKSSDVSPTAVEVMRELGIDITKHRPRTISESFKEHFTVVVTMSDDTRERSPVWPFTRNLLHWNLADPAAVPGPPDEQRQIFCRVRDEIRTRVDDFARHLAPKLHRGEPKP